MEFGRNESAGFRRLTCAVICAAMLAVPAFGQGVGAGAGGADVGSHAQQPGATASGVGVIEAPDSPSAYPGDIGGMNMPSPGASYDSWPEQGVLDAGDEYVPDLPEALMNNNLNRRSFLAEGRAQMPQISAAPVVVELFTSQGCSSCPPADALLASLADQPDVLPLAFHVDYWDYLGWADEFARPEFTNRQKSYAQASGERAIYTPQMIVDGTDTMLSLRPADLMGMIDAHRAEQPALGVTTRREGDAHVIELQPLVALSQPVAVVMIRYLPNREIEVRAGENRGRVLNYRNIVTSVELLARWDARASLRLTVTPGAEGSAEFPPDTRHAILVQSVQGRKGNIPGAILTAIRLD